MVVVTIDTLRADHTSLESPHLGTTPNLARIARDGARFNHAYSPSATTGPAHASLFTGLYPAWHGVSKNGVVLEDGVTTLAERFQAAGYETAAFVSSFVLSRRFGFDQGFEIYDDEFPLSGAKFTFDEWEGIELDEAFDRRGNVTVDRALEFLDGKVAEKRPFFLFVHLFDPHSPYLPPKPFASQFGANLERRATLREKVRRYDAEIAFADAQLGRLVDGMQDRGLLRDALLVVSADHGEGLMEDGLMEHGARIFESLVWVPLVLRWPGRIEAGAQIDEPVNWLDLSRTLLGLLTEGGETRALGEYSAGRNLFDRLATGGSELGESPIFFHRRHYEPGHVDLLRVDGERYGVLEGRYKLVGPGDGEAAALFDLHVDREERFDLFDDDGHRDVADRLTVALDAWISKFPEGSDGRLAPAVRTQLEVLGYAE